MATSAEIERARAAAEAIAVELSKGYFRFEIGVDDAEYRDAVRRAAAEEVIPIILAHCFTEEQPAPQNCAFDTDRPVEVSLDGWVTAPQEQPAICPHCLYGSDVEFPPTVPATSDSFQGRVQPWMLACFGAEISGDKQERNHRFLEEALELVQACACTQHEAHQLVDYVYGRKTGEPSQEVGGVMVTLAALCLANGLDMHDAGEAELTRIWTKVETIRAKQAAKPPHSPLPEVPTTHQNTVGLPRESRTNTREAGNDRDVNLQGQVSETESWFTCAKCGTKRLCIEFLCRRCFSTEYSSFIPLESSSDVSQGGQGVDAGQLLSATVGTGLHHRRSRNLKLKS